MEISNKPQKDLKTFTVNIEKTVISEAWIEVEANDKEHADNLVFKLNRDEFDKLKIIDDADGYKEVSRIFNVKTVKLGIHKPPKQENRVKSLKEKINSQITINKRLFQEYY